MLYNVESYRALYHILSNIELYVVLTMISALQLVDDTISWKYCPLEKLNPKLDAF